MSDKYSVSRRATLKNLGAVGATIALGGVAAAAQQAEPRPARSDQDKPVNVVDLAVDRFGKGHS